ncbi:MAG: hemerythrin domain-containing protein [Candidatus Riflebacteria bacterium]|nr:hemerythrin domain-containing protein [Candidatus Riflebacteria bacterium]
MHNFEPYQEQHQEILALMTGLLERLHEPMEINDSMEVLRNLGILAEKIRLHLAQEDNLLYPYFFRHPNTEVRETAQRYMASMGNLNQTFQEYLHRWNVPEKISHGPQDFIQETKLVFEVMAKRMLSEEAELYPLTRRANG